MKTETKKYFGTDGIRDRANCGAMTPEFAVILGRSVIQILKENKDKINVCVGMDTRISGDMIKSSLTAGMLSEGADITELGIFPTPGVSHIASNYGFDLGVVISASHNPYYDNGIKFLGPEGTKLSDEIEAKIEGMFTKLPDGPRPEPGRLIDGKKLSRRYIAWLESILPFTGHRDKKPLRGLKVAVDCANGATSKIFPNLMKRLGAQVSNMANRPNGRNINLDCGATSTCAISNLVKKTGAHMGITFDGDGDRVLFVDSSGELVDGDAIMAGWAIHSAGKNRLNPPIVVTTVMANLGLEKALVDAGIKVNRTKVGDKYVAHEMNLTGAPIGGEQSGHIIFRDLTKTGDGMATALMIIATMLEKKETLAQLVSVFKRFPQILVNVPVADRGQWGKNHELGEKISGVEKRLSPFERLLIRPSGTEPIIRVMAESTDEDRCRHLVDETVALIKEYLS